MALSFDAVVKAYKVFSVIRKEVIPDLSIPAWPADMAEWTRKKRDNPQENIVYGYDKKSDSGWENLVFFVKHPSPELKKRFDELKENVPNSSISEPYSENTELWVFGWF